MIAARNKTHVQKLKAQLKKRFGRNQEDLRYEDHSRQRLGRLWLSQENYVLKVLERFNMTEVRPVTTLLAGHSNYPPSSIHNQEEEEMS